MRSCFLVIITLLMVSLKFAAGEVPGPEAAKIDWKQCNGETISLFLSIHPWQEAIERYIPDFEKLTGIRVNVSRMTEQRFVKKVIADFTEGTSNFDVFMSQYYEAPKFASERWTADMTGFLRDPAMTDLDWFDWDDFFLSARYVATVGDKYFDRIAITAEVPVLFYREDLYRKFGLSVPKTFDKLLANAKTISRNTNMAGITLRGGISLWHPMYGVIRSYGGGYFDSEWNPLINTQPSIDGAKLYLKLCKYTPPDLFSCNWDEINTAILKGKAAMFLDSSVIYSRIKDPGQSQVADKIKVAPYPLGPGGRISHSHYWTISIAECSKKKKAAWLFVTWATSKDTVLKVGSRGVLPPRESIWDEPMFVKHYTEDFRKSVHKSLVTAEISAAHPLFFEMMGVLTPEIQKVMRGEKDLVRALDDVQAQWKKMVGTGKTSQ